MLSTCKEVAQQADALIRTGHAHTHTRTCTDGQAQGAGERRHTNTTTLPRILSSETESEREQEREEAIRSEPQIQRRSTSSRRVMCQKLQHLLQPIRALSSNRVAVKVQVGE